MDKKYKVPDREPDFKIIQGSQNLNFWWEEKIQTNFSRYQLRTHVFRIDMDKFQYSEISWELDDLWLEYEDFLTKADFNLLKDSYLNWLLEKNFIKET